MTASFLKEKQVVRDLRFKSTKLHTGPKNTPCLLSSYRVRAKRERAEPQVWALTGAQVGEHGEPWWSHTHTHTLLCFTTVTLGKKREKNKERVVARMTANLSAPCFNACFSNQPAFLTRTPGGARDGARLGQKVTLSARRSLPAPISGRIAAITAADRDKWGRRYQRNNGVCAK